jgi:hypothetical protein
MAVEEARMAVLADRIDAALRAELAPMGFHLVRPRRWVSGTKGSIRRIFEFQATRGAGYSARWGFSLDFVPIARNGYLRWKRTPKGADFDLCIDPIDEFGDVPDWCSFVHLPGYMEADTDQIIQAVKDSTGAARNDFARVESVGDLISMFRNRAQMTFRRFSLENYVQTHLAWGLGLTAIGQHREGDTHISLFCAQRGIDRNDPLLRKAETEAARYAATPPSNCT